MSSRSKLPAPAELRYKIQLSVDGVSPLALSTGRAFSKKEWCDWALSYASELEALSSPATQCPLSRAVAHDLKWAFCKPRNFEAAKLGIALYLEAANSLKGNHQTSDLALTAATRALLWSINLNQKELTLKALMIAKPLILAVPSESSMAPGTLALMAEVLLSINPPESYLAEITKLKRQFFQRARVHLIRNTRHQYHISYGADNSLKEAIFAVAKLAPDSQSYEQLLHPIWENIRKLSEEALSRAKQLNRATSPKQSLRLAGIKLEACGALGKLLVTLIPSKYRCADDEAIFHVISKEAGELLELAGDEVFIPKPLSEKSARVLRELHELLDLVPSWSHVELMEFLASVQLLGEEHLMQPEGNSERLLSSSDTLKIATVIKMPDANGVSQLGNSLNNKNELIEEHISLQNLRLRQVFSIMPIDQADVVLNIYKKRINGLRPGNRLSRNAGNIFQCIQMYLYENFTLSFTLGTMLIEELLRIPVSRQELPVTVSKHNKGAVQTLTLEQLLATAESNKVIDRSLLITLKQLFSGDRGGLNLRNRLCHGHLSDEELHRSPLAYACTVWLKLLDAVLSLEEEKAGTSYTCNS